MKKISQWSKVQPFTRQESATKIAANLKRGIVFKKLVHFNKTNQSRKGDVFFFFVSQENSDSPKVAHICAQSNFSDN